MSESPQPIYVARLGGESYETYLYSGEPGDYDPDAVEDEGYIDPDLFRTWIAARNAHYAIEDHICRLLAAQREPAS